MSPEKLDRLVARAEAVIAKVRARLCTHLRAAYPLRVTGTALHPVVIAITHPPEFTFHLCEVVVGSDTPLAVLEEQVLQFFDPRFRSRAVEIEN